MAKVFEPRDYQQYGINLLIEKKELGLFFKPGLGKTVSVLTAIEKLMYDSFEIKHALVIAPKRVALTVWTDEVQEWEHTKNLRVNRILGTEKQRVMNLLKPADIYVINRENVVWLREVLHKFKLENFFDMLVVDESSSFKNHTSKRFKALRTLIPGIDRKVILTGTPAPKGYLNLWPQVYLLDQGKTLGKTITQYRDTYFKPDQRNGNIIYNYKLKEGAAEKITALLKPFCVSVQANVCSDLQKPLIVDVKAVLAISEQKVYDQLEKEMVLSYKDGDVVATTAAILNQKLLQLANGAVYDENGATKQYHDQKLEALAELIEAAQENPVLVFYNYKHDLERIKKQHKNARELKTEQDIKDWKAGKIQIGLAHPASCGHGLNLQSGGHLAVWFGLTYDLELYEQANARLARPGQKEQVIIHRIIAKGTIDEIVASALEAKAVNQNMIINKLKARYN